MCVCVCVCVCVHARTHVDGTLTRVCKSVCVHACMCVCVCVCVRARVHVVCIEFDNIMYL